MKTVLILSGGMDSTTLLYDLMNTHKPEWIKVLSFNYGQRHKKELEFAANTCKKLGVEHHIIDLSNLTFLISNSALTNPNIEVPEGHYEDESMKSTVVPNRNSIMLSIAVGYAESLSFDCVAIANHTGDHCLPGAEVVITRLGKKSVFDLAIGDEVLSFDKKTQQISFQKIVNKVSEGFRKDMVRVTAKSGRSLVTTSNHKYYKVNRHSFHRSTGWQKDLVEEKAENLRSGDWVVVPRSDRDLSTSQVGDLPLIDLLPYCDRNHPQLQFDDTNIWFKKTNKVSRYVFQDNFIKLLAWFITEGNRGGSKIAKNSNTYSVGIPQSIIKNPENCKEIQQVISAWGFHISPSGEGKDTTYYFSGPTTKIFELCGNVSFEKKIPEDFLLLDPVLLLNTLIKGDGSIKEAGYAFNYTTASSLLKEQVCFLGVLLGYSVGYSCNSAGVFSINLGKNFRKNMNGIGEVKIVQIKSVEKEEGQNVWAITIENNRNFFAGTGSGLLVSNSIYPDCRSEFITTFSNAEILGTYNHIFINAPYTHISKADIAEIGLRLGIDYDADTWSCYKGGDEHCHKCGTCVERDEALFIAKSRIIQDTSK
jgi:7-cyano-7-deazaguanine synthase in queuosine biosynthesis